MVRFLDTHFCTLLLFLAVGASVAVEVLNL